jgi:hypothetical protein
VKLEDIEISKIRQAQEDTIWILPFIRGLWSSPTLRSKEENAACQALGWWVEGMSFQLFQMKVLEICCTTIWTAFLLNCTLKNGYSGFYGFWLWLSPSPLFLGSVSSADHQLLMLGGYLGSLSVERPTW